MLQPEIRYNGWRPPTEEWQNWVKKLRPKFEYLWIQTGIYDAIKASTYEIKRDEELILELANRWRSETNTFVFPWGESTLTLQDTEVCFGYSLLGCSISNPLMNSDQIKAEEELMEARRMFNSSKAKNVNQRAWMMYFMESESKVEHEAFLSYWLSRFVFPADAYQTILKSVFPIAIHLAHGNRIALAPPVLASIYRDLSLLNSNITTTIKSLRVTIWAPFQLVQIWALERFLALKPRPYTIRHGLPKVARWSGVEVLKNQNLKRDLDCAGFGNCFLWQPYENSPCVEVYNEKDMWKCYNPCLDEELLSFAGCLRDCELVGMACREKYLPHRVAVQFGMDQDISNNVASRYFDWWKQSKSCEERENERVMVEIHQMEGSDKDHLLGFELLCPNDEVIENGKTLCSNEFGAFTSSDVGDKCEKSENAERVMSKLKEKQDLKITHSTP